MFQQTRFHTKVHEVRRLAQSLGYRLNVVGGTIEVWAELVQIAACSNWKNALWFLRGAYWQRERDFHGPFFGTGEQLPSPWARVDFDESIALASRAGLTWYDSNTALPHVGQPVILARHARLESLDVVHYQVAKLTTHDHDDMLFWNLGPGVGNASVHEHLFWAPLENPYQ